MLFIQTGLQIRVQHWGDDRQILVIFLILGGGGRGDEFLSLDLAMPKLMLFLIIFFQIFLDDLFFLLTKLFHTFLIKIP